MFREICGSLIKAAWEKFIAEKKTPTEFMEYTEVYCSKENSHRFHGFTQMQANCSVNSVNSVGVNICVNL